MRPQDYGVTVCACMLWLSMRYRLLCLHLRVTEVSGAQLGTARSVQGFRQQRGPSIQFTTDDSHDEEALLCEHWILTRSRKTMSTIA